MKLTKFHRKVYNLVCKIPKGKVTTYKILAQAIGKPKNWREIGYLLSQNPFPQQVPCYKVVKSNGEIGGYNGGKLLKKKLLQKDGLKIYNNKIKDFKKHLFRNFSLA